MRPTRTNTTINRDGSEAIEGGAQFPLTKCARCFGGVSACVKDVETASSTTTQQLATSWTIAVCRFRI